MLKSVSIFEIFSAGDVVGPATSVVGDLAAFNNTTGTLLKDTGIQYATLTGGPFLPKSGGTITGNLTLSSTLTDSLSSAGSAGQVLSSTGSAVKWIAAGGGSQTPWTSDIDGGAYNLTNTASVTSGQFNLSQDSSNQSGIAWEPYVGGTTLQAPAGSTVYIQGAGETSLGSILMFSPTVQLNGGGGGVTLETQGTDQLNIESGAGINIYELSYGINISAPEDVSISSAGAVQCSAAVVIMNGVNIDSGGNLTANSLNANNGFTGTGSYSHFTIVNGIITSAS